MVQSLETGALLAYSSQKVKLRIHDSKLANCLGEPSCSHDDSQQAFRNVSQAAISSNMRRVSEGLMAEKAPIKGDRAFQARLMRLQDANEALTKLKLKDAQVREANAARRECRDQQILNDVYDGLLNSTGAVGQAQATLQRAAKLKQDKAKSLYNAWQKMVFDQISGQVQQALATRSVRGIEKRLRRQFQNYITTANKKVAIFRDIVIPDDYDPFTARQCYIRYKAAGLQDPVKKDLLKPYIEASAMGVEVSSPTGGKYVLPVTFWDKLESTPYGRCTAPDGSYILPPQSQRLSALRTSRIVFDHYNVPTGNKVAAAEVSKGKAVHHREPKQDLFEVLQRVDECKTTTQLIAEGKADGDEWLSHRGRRVVPGPELRRSRKGLFDVVHHLCAENLQQDPTFTGGDEWLERKGKRNVLGPEQRRGRKNLFETFQQSSNPYQDGRTLDDAFLETKGKNRLPHTADANMSKILQDHDIEVKPAPTQVKRYYISELVPVDGSMTTRAVPRARQ